MAIETICSGCGKKLAVADEHAGKRARCPACGQIYTVPLFENQSEETGQLGEVRPYPEPSDSATSGFGERESERRNDAFAETIAGPEGVSTSQNNPSPIPQIEQFWMQTGEGSLYGPVDRTNLYRWFQEGRVGPGYQIRVGDAGTWQPAELFRPQVQGVTYTAGIPNSAAPNAGGSAFNNPNFTGAGNGGDNPYAENAYRPVYPTSIGRFQKNDPSGLVLTMGILSWVCLFLCPFIHWIPGLLAWIYGSSGLKDIQAGIADPSNRALVQVGYYLGMINVIITLLGVAGLAAFTLLAGIAQNF